MLYHSCASLIHYYAYNTNHFKVGCLFFLMSIYLKKINQLKICVQYVFVAKVMHVYFLFFFDIWVDHLLNSVLNDSMLFKKHVMEETL